MLLATGCATNRGYMDLATPTSATAATGDKPVVIETVQDARRFVVDPPDPSTPSIKEGAKFELGAEELKRVIARKRNTYGMALGDILLEGDDAVETLTRDLVKEALARRGYTAVDAAGAPSDAPRVRVHIDEFWAWFTPGFWAVKMEAKVATSIEIDRDAGLSKVTARGCGINKGQSGREGNWRVAYDNAFKDYIEKLVAALDSAGY